MKIAFLLFSIIFSLLSSRDVKATVDQTNYCVPLAKNVDKVFVNYTENIPDSELINWDKVIHETTRTAQNLLMNENIELQHTKQKNSAILKQNPESLYLELMYSYINKNAASIPMPDDQIVTWIRASRIIDGDIKTVILRSFGKVHFIPYPANAEPEHKQIKLRASQVRGMYFLTCTILHSTANKICSDMSYGAEHRTSKLQLKTLAQACVDMPEDLRMIINNID